MSLDDIYKIRLSKLEKLKKEGINPYPSISRRTHTIKQALEGFDDFEKDVALLVLAGRIMARREHGGSLFIDLHDGSGSIQAYIKKDEVGDKEYEIFQEVVDIGDFIEVKGTLFKTRKGERTIKAKEWTMLSKSLAPLPEKWHGLRDIEERYRKRYLDLIMNPEVKEIFKVRSKVVESIRDYLNKRGYVEIQTPILQPIYGGGSARPFITKLNALDMTVYLRIANELYLKRLVVGGFDKVYEFSIDFRNEGIDSRHNPEFLLFEAMTAYEDYNFGMEIIENITEHLAKSIKGTTKIDYQGTTIDFKKPWERISVKDAIKKYAGIDIESTDDNKMQELLKKYNIELTGKYTRGNAIMALVEEFCEKHFIQPTILYDYPAETSPLAKRKEDEPRYVERFEQYVYGMEVGNNYSELNDSRLLAQNWREQEEALKGGDEEAQRTDKDFINALEIGMPPTCGIAISIDRMAMLLTNQKSIKEVIPFPFMRPKESTDSK